LININETIMEKFGIWYYFALTIVLVYLTIGATYVYYTNKALLARKGYSTDHIRFVRLDVSRRLLGIAVAVPLILIMAGAVVRLVYGEFDLTSGPQSFLFILLFIVFTAPFPLLDIRKSNRKNKELAIQTGSEIVIDLDYKVLHKLFNPTAEIVASVIYLIMVLILVGGFHISLAHVGILWLLYAAVRSARNQTRPALKDGYMYGFLFMSINHLLLVYHMLCLTYWGPDISITLFISGLILVLFLTLKLVFYMINYGVAKRELSD